MLGYTAEAAVSDQHFIVATRVTLKESDNDSLLPLVEEVERQCDAPPEQVLADAGFFSLENVAELEQHGMDAYVPDSNLGCELNPGRRAPAHCRPRHAGHRRMRQKLRSPAGRPL